jgi:hypothetical protein
MLLNNWMGRADFMKTFGSDPRVVEGAPEYLKTAPCLKKPE